MMFNNTKLSVLKSLLSVKSSTKNAADKLIKHNIMLTQMPVRGFEFEDRRGRGRPSKYS